MLMASPKPKLRQRSKPYIRYVQDSIGSKQRIILRYAASPQCAVPKPMIDRITKYD